MNQWPCSSESNSAETDTVEESIGARQIMLEGLFSIVVRVAHTHVKVVLRLTTDYHQPNITRRLSDA